MKALAARATRYRNRLEGRTGTLWESRYKSSVVESDAYLLACCRYIELNPVRARMVVEAGDYLWSSYRMRVTDQASRVDNALLIHRSLKAQSNASAGHY